VLPGSRARIVRCGGRYDPQLVKRSSEWVSEWVIVIRQCGHSTYRAVMLYHKSTVALFSEHWRVVTVVRLLYNKKLSCRRKTARRFVSLNITEGHSRRSFEMTLLSGPCVGLVFHWNYTLHCVSENWYPFCFCNNLVECQPISVIFGTVTPE